MRKIISLCAAVAVFFAMSNIVVETADAQTVILKSWSRKINDPKKRFEVLKKFNHEAVLDREPQLVSERAPQDPFLPGTFSVAVAHCYARIVGDRMGWRLPTVEELTSLLAETPTTNPEVIRAALPSGHPFIGIRSGDRPAGDRPGSAYWSITAGSASFGEGRFTVAVNELEVSTVALETNLLTAT